MAQKTQAEQKAAAAVEQVRRDNQRVEQYLPQLMTALEEAMKLANFELTVRNGQFVLRDRDVSKYDYDYEREVYLSPVYTQMNWEQLEELQITLRRKAEDRAERERQREVRKAALDKLNKEERELLRL